MKNRSIVPMQVAKSGYIVMSLVFCALGIVFMAMPELSTQILGYLLGGSMVLFGAVKLVGYFSRDLYRLAFQHDLGFGVLSVVLGLVLLLRPGETMRFLSVAVGVATLADGLFKIQTSMDARKFGLKSWWLILALAILTGMAGLLLVFRPWEAAQIMTILLGVALCTEGLLNLWVAILTVKIVRNQKPDQMDGDIPKF